MAETLEVNKPEKKESPAVAKSEFEDIEDAIARDEKKDKGTAEFIKRYVEAGGDPRELTEERAAAIEGALKKVPAVRKELAGFVRNQIRKGAEITLGNSIEESLGAYLEDVAMTQPEMLDMYGQALEMFRSAPERIAEKEKKIDEMLKDVPGYDSLVDRREELRAERAVAARPIEARRKEHRKAVRTVLAYERLKESRGNRVTRFFGNLKDKLFGKPVKVQYEQSLVSGSPETVRANWEAASRLSAIEENLADVERNISTHEQVDALKATTHQAFEEYRQQFIETVVPIQELAERASDMAQMRLVEYLGKGTLESLQQAQTYLDHLRTQDTGLDFLQGMDSEGMQREIDFQIAAAVNTELDAQIEKTFAVLDSNSQGAGVYNELEKAVEPYLGLEKLGSKNAARTKKFFANIIRNKINELEGPENEVKRTLLKQVAAKHGLFENKVVFIRGARGEGIWQKE